MSEFNISTRKIQILVNSSDKVEKNKHYGTLRFFADECTKASNYVVNQQHINFNIRERIKLYNPDINLKYDVLEIELTELEKELNCTSDKTRKAEIKKRKKEIFSLKKELDNSLSELEMGFYLKSGTSTTGDNPPVQNSTYQLLARKFHHLPSYIRSSLNDIIYKNLKKDLKDVLMGKKSVRTYRTKLIYFAKSCIRDFKYNQESKEFEFSLFKIPVTTKLGKDKSDNMTILARLLSGQYQMGDSTILVEDKKIFLLLVVKSPKIELDPQALDPKISVGVDLGIEIPVFVTSTQDKWGKQFGNRKALFHKKISYRKQRTALQKTISTTHGGHGYKTKMRKLEDIKKTEANYTKTLFHNLSKQVVEYAINQKAKTIKMEFLEGISEEESKIKSLVRFWAPRHLQTLIEQKAKKENIEVVYVDPYHTSQTCSHCGHWEENQRTTRNFLVCKNADCKQFGKKQHADRNAAFNIAKSIKVVTKKDECEYIKQLKLKKNKEKELSAEFANS